MVQQLPLMTVTTPPQGPELEPEETMQVGSSECILNGTLSRLSFHHMSQSSQQQLVTMVTADAVAVSHLMTSDVSEATHQTRVVLHRNWSEVK